MDGTGKSKINATFSRTRASMWMFAPFRTSSAIEWAHHAKRASVHDVRIDHCRPHGVDEGRDEISTRGAEMLRERRRFFSIRGRRVRRYRKAVPATARVVRMALGAGHDGIEPQSIARNRGIWAQFNTRKHGIWPRRDLECDVRLQKRQM